MPLLALVVVALVAGATTWAITASNETSNRDASKGRGCRAQVIDGTKPLAIGSPAPTFRLPTLDGGCVNLASYRGRPVVVNFWASWCNPCRREFPLFRDALTRHRDDHLAVLGIAHDDIASDARQFARERNASWPLLLDENNDVADAFGVKPIPQTFFIRPDGTLASRVYGLTSQKDLEAEITRLLRTS